MGGNLREHSFSQSTKNPQRRPTPEQRWGSVCEEVAIVTRRTFVGNW